MMIINDARLDSCFRSVDDVIEGLTDLEQSYIEAKDTRGAFVTAYLSITELLQEWMIRDRFVDHETTAAYVVAFANRYRQSLTQHSCGNHQNVPEPWRLALHRPDQVQPSWIHSLLLGINAHINYDLPLAILDSGLDLKSDSSLQDHLLINSALMHSTPTVRQRVLASYEPRMSSRFGGKLFGKWFDSSLQSTFRRSRTQAWDWALRLDEALPGESVERVRIALTEMATQRAQNLLETPAKSMTRISAFWEIPHQVSLIG